MFTSKISARRSRELMLTRDSSESAVPSAIGGAAPKEQDTRQPIIKFATMPVRPTKWNNQVDEIRQMMNQFDVSSAGAQRQARRPPSPSVRSIYWAEHEQQRQEALRRAAAAAQSRAVRPRTPTPEPEPAPQVDTTPRNPTDESCAPPPPPAPPKEKPFFKKFISRSLGRQSMLGRIFLSSKKEHIVQPSMIPPAGYFKVGEGLSQRSAFQNVGWAEEQRQYLRVLEESRRSARG